MNIEDYSKIVKELIEKSFPSLRKSKINIKENSKIPSSACIREGFLTDYVLSINPTYCNSCNKKQLSGILAHELCHPELWKKRSHLKKLVIGLLTSFSFYNEKEEKATDIKAICKGYGAGLKSFRLKRAKTKDKNYCNLRKFYLSPKEISLFNCKRMKDNFYLAKFNTSKYFL